MAKDAYERKLEAISALRHETADIAIPELRKALKDRNNFAVSKAAAIAGDRLFLDLEPDLVVAFQRFFRDAVKSDPQCWAKNALVKALKDVGHRDAETYLPGVHHVQMEPVWGGRQDTAITLRGACAHALTNSTLDTFTILTHLTDLLADPAAPVRTDAARAMAQLGAREGILPLRLKALSGDPEPEVVGHCLIALLSLDEPAHLPFIGAFLDHDDADFRIEAAAALAESRDAKAFAMLKDFWDRQLDPQVRATLLLLFAASPNPSSAAFLQQIAEEGSPRLAEQARQALAQSRHRSPTPAGTNE